LHGNQRLLRRNLRGRRRRVASLQAPFRVPRGWRDVRDTIRLLLGPM
jgi:hypothetical protein